MGTVLYRPRRFSLPYASGQSRRDERDIGAPMVTDSGSHCDSRKCEGPSLKRHRHALDGDHPVGGGAPAARDAPTDPRLATLDLPWLPDRFYLDAIAGIDDAREGHREEEDEEEEAFGERRVRERDVREVTEERAALQRRFSLQELVGVVTGAGWPGIRAAIFGTFSLDMRKIAEDIPCLFSIENRSTPVLILHGNKSLERRRRAKPSTPEHGVGDADDPSNASGGADATGRGGIEGVTRGGNSGVGSHLEDGVAGGREGDTGDEDCFRAGDRRPLPSARVVDLGGITEEYEIAQKAMRGRVLIGRRENCIAAGREERIYGWSMTLPGTIQVERVKQIGSGVHHPKFGLVFLNDGSVVMYVSTRNLGADMTIDATCALQDFLEQESRLMAADCAGSDIGLREVERTFSNTPVAFMQRVLGITCIGDSFDFRTACVDLVPSIPLPRRAEPRRDARGTELSGRSSVKSPARPRCSRTDSGTLSSSPVSLTPPRRADTMPATWQSRSELTASSSAVSQVAAVDESLRRSRSLPPPGSPGSPKYPESIGSPGSPSSPRSPSDGGVHIPGRGKGSHGRRLYRYGQLRLQDVLVKRLGEAGKNGPDDLLIISPTSIGAGMDSKFMEVLAQSCMPESVGSRSELWAEHNEPRLESVRIIWPSRQYIEACRRNMARSTSVRVRQATTMMGVDDKHVWGACNECKPQDVSGGFIFLTPTIFDDMGPDVHDSLRTFKPHPGVHLPWRMSHVKCAMRLRPRPTQIAVDAATEVCPRDSSRGGTVDEVEKTEMDETPVEDSTSSPREHEQHLAWFLLTSACLSKGAQGEIEHARRSGRVMGIKCKNVELGVLFHSSPRRAYYVEPPNRCVAAPGRVPPGASSSRKANANANTGRGTERAAGSTLPELVPLPVPFCLDSEAYCDREQGSPHPRFLPFMHFTQEWPRSAQVERLLASEEIEAQFAFPS